MRNIVIYKTAKYESSTVIVSVCACVYDTQYFIVIMPLFCTKKVTEATTNYLAWDDSAREVTSGIMTIDVRTGDLSKLNEPLVVSPRQEPVDNLANNTNATLDRWNKMVYYYIPCKEPATYLSLMKPDPDDKEVLGMDVIFQLFFVIRYTRILLI